MLSIYQGVEVALGTVSAGIRKVLTCPHMIFCGAIQPGRFTELLGSTQAMIDGFGHRFSSFFAPTMPATLGAHHLRARLFSLLVQLLTVDAQWTRSSCTADAHATVHATVHARVCCCTLVVPLFGSPVAIRHAQVCVYVCADSTRVRVEENCEALNLPQATLDHWTQQTLLYSASNDAPVGVPQQDPPASRSKPKPAVPQGTPSEEEEAPDAAFQREMVAQVRQAAKLRLEDNKRKVLDTSPAMARVCQVGRARALLLAAGVPSI
jgi:hypothetical protein